MPQDIMTFMDDFTRVTVGGRSLRVRCAGEGTPVVYMHGGLGSVHETPADDQLLAHLGVRLARIERPGFGESSRHLGRTLVTWADDVRAVLDALGIARAGILGWSGGVPHALATAALAPERTAALSLVGAAPHNPGWQIDGSDPATLDRARAELAAFVAPLVALTAQPFALVDAIFSQMPAVDQALPDAVRAMLAASYAEALRHDGGAIDEMVVLRTPWPFALGDVACDVHLWTGALDRNTPPAGAQALADALPRARHDIVPDRGHSLIFSHAEAILTSLRDRTRDA